MLFDQGWAIHGGGAAATKAAFNLLGGYVEYDVDVSAVHTGVNANIYTISPKVGASGFSQANYCDGSVGAREYCLEVDWLESNGNCGGATTLHTVPGPGPSGCTAWGCTTSYHYGGRSKFHMRIDYTAGGVWTTTRDGHIIAGGSLSPQPAQKDWDVVGSYYNSVGAVIYSSQWVGWVPVEDCGKTGDLGSSLYTITNLVVYGKVLAGPQPRICPT
jgi:hypothetical protein